MGNVRVVDAIIIVVYFAVMAVMGIIAYRRNKTSEDFFVAGKSMGTFSLAAMWLSSWIGGSSIVGTSTDAYNLGVTGGWYVTILAVGCVIFGLTFSKVTKTLGDKLKNITYPGLIMSRYDRVSSDIVIICCFLANVGFLASQLVAMGSMLTTITGWSASTCFIISTVIFLCAVALLVTHAQTGLTVSCIGVFITIVTLIAAGRDALKLIKQIDYKTLLFFIGLFMVVGGLEQTGILKVMANFIGDISNGNLMLMIAIILWISAIASAFVDNIPFAATMIPIISSLSAAQGVDLSILAWALAMGTDIGGSATPIGASANVVGIATAAKAGHMIKWGKYCKVMAPATIIVIVISMVMIYARYL